MAGAGVIQIFYIRQTFAIGIAGFREQLFCFRDVCCITGCRGIIIVAAYRAEFLCLIRVGQADGYETARRNLTRFADILDNEVTVNREG